MGPSPVSDMFSKLSDELLCSILSLIPIKEAVRCSVLSKRWRYLYTKMPQLTLSPYFIMGSVSNPNPPLIVTVENIISDILLSHSSDLQSFYLSAVHSLKPYSWQFRYQSVVQWLQCAARKKVQNLGLCHSSEKADLVLALFSCAHLRTLRLSNYIVSYIPPNFGGFNHLITCHFFDIDFRNDSLDRFISHCPHLENLKISKSAEAYYRSAAEIDYPFGLQKLIISAPNITVICVEVYNLSRDFEPVELLNINCPKLEVFTTNYSSIKDLKVNELLFQELSFAVQRLEIQCGSNVIGLSLNSTWKEHNISAERFLEIMGPFKSLKKLSVEWVAEWSPNLMKVPVLNLLQTLPRLEHLDLSGINGFIWELGGHPIPPSPDQSLAVNIRVINIEIDPFVDEDMSVLSGLLESTPLLETMEVRIPLCAVVENEGSYMQVLMEIMNLRRASSQARVHVYFTCGSF